MVALSVEMEEVLQQVKSWPVESRIALARRLLETMDAGSATMTEGVMGSPAQQVLGLWNPGSVAPTDAECDEILADELRRKHAS